MLRKARTDAAGALNHVIIRGIERKKIFRSDNDRRDFLIRISELISETKTDCFAWAMIPNHAYLSLKTGSVPLAVFMSRLLTGYAVWFNRQYRRHGQVFQNRYKSILCQEDRCLVAIQERGILVEIKVCEKFYLRHIVDIPRIKF
jgi:putative transposase